MTNFENYTIAGFNIFDGEEYALSKVFYALFGELANEKQLTSKFKVDKLAHHLIDIYDLENKPAQIRYNVGYKFKIKKTTVPFAGKKGSDKSWLLILKNGFLIEIRSYKVTIQTNSNIAQEEIEAFEKELVSFKKNDKKDSPKFYMISNRYGGFNLEKFHVNDCKIDISMHYNDDFPVFNNDVSDFLQNKKRHGLVLLHGKSGTGKTTYIRHLIGKVKRKFVFLPLHMAETLSNPELLPFLSENKNCILIIEDCEKLIVERENGQFHNEIATLLNLSDGLLNDALGIKLICTFNTAFSKIDQALTRKGRMVNRYEFKELDVHKANDLAEKHDLPYNGLAPITIGDLFNIEKDNNMTGLKSKRIGFSG